MARIPLRALGRPLSGKHARFGNTPPVAPPPPQAPPIEPAPPVTVAPVATTVDVAPVATAIAPMDVAPVVEPTPTQSEPEPDGSVDAMLADVVATPIEPAPAPKPEWDANWSKTKLITFAQSKGVSVTAANTKDEIVAALAGK